jgi:GDP-L-fucose synthase
MQRSSRIFVAGHRGLAGSALCRRFAAEGYTNLLLRTHSELDLENQGEVEGFFLRERPEYVLLGAAKVGGIHANQTYPVDFLLRNLKIQNNVLEAAWRHNVKGLLFLGSSCIYPRLAPQPLREESLLSGLLEPTNEPYAIGKIAGIELCDAFNRQYGTRFFGVMPTNLYGPNDNYDLENSHVLPALIRKFHLGKMASQGAWDAIKRDAERYGPIPKDFYGRLACIARSNGYPAPPISGEPDSKPAVTLWGSGTARREFLYSDDLADACLFLMQRLKDIFSTEDSPNSGHRYSHATRHIFNIGKGADLSIKELAAIVAGQIGFTAEVEWDTTKPDGTPQKLLDTSRLAKLGWQSKISLEEGVRLAYRDYSVRKP